MRRADGVCALAVAVGACARGSSPAAERTQDAGWRADSAIVAQTSARQPMFNFDERQVSPYALPPVLGRGADVVTTRDAWRARRAVLLEQFRTHVYGRSPGAPGSLRFEVLEGTPHAMNSAATMERVAVISTNAGREHRFVLTMFLPNGRGRVPVFLLLNNRTADITDPTRATRSPFWPAEQLVARGYGIASVQNGELAPDDKARYQDGVMRIFRRGSDTTRAPDAWGALGAWAWGASRVMDYLATHPMVDTSRVAVVGHSRGGKAALWAGAQDERFAMVVSNESGEGGAALARRKYGETTARITTVFPHWFAPRLATYAAREHALPVDQHMLLALIAPRALYVASANGDLWSDPRGEFLALAHSSPVYALWGEPPIRPSDMPPLDQSLIVGSRGYHVRRGAHDLTVFDWERFVDLADRLWRR